MPIKVIQDDGQEVEALTPEEAEAIAAEKAEDARVQAEQELAEMRAKLEETESEYAKLKEKDYNFSKLRKQAEKKSGEVDLTEKLNEITAKIKQEVVEEVKKVPIEDFKQDFIAQHVGSDKELQDKFNYYFGKLGQGVTDKKELERAAAEALTLASGGASKSGGSGGIFATGVGASFMPSGQAMTESKMEMAKMFGNTEEDFKKYGGK